MNPKASKSLIKSSIGVLYTRQLCKISDKLDKYHQQVREGFTLDLQQTIQELRQEKKETAKQFAQILGDRDRTLTTTRTTVERLHDTNTQLEKKYVALNSEWRHLTTAHTEITQRYTALSKEHQTVLETSRTLQHASVTMGAQMSTLEQTVSLLRLESKELQSYQRTCIQLRAEIPWLKSAVEKANTENKAATTGYIRLQASYKTLRQESKQLTSDNLLLPQLLKTSRWFQHFLPNIDIQALTSIPKVGHAQEVATHALLQSLFADQFYAIEVVSDKGHRGDIRIQPEQNGPSVLVEVKTYLPTSKGVLRNGVKAHEVQTKGGRQKLIEDLDQNRAQGCLAGVMVIHETQFIPGIQMCTGESVVNDPEHPHIFYAYMSTKHLRKTILAAVCYAYTIQGRIQAENNFVGKIENLTSLLGKQNEDVIQAIAGASLHLKTFAKQHKTHTSEAAVLGISLRSLMEASGDLERQQKPSVVRKRQKTA